MEKLGWKAVTGPLVGDFRTIDSFAELSTVALCRLVRIHPQSNLCHNNCMTDTFLGEVPPPEVIRYPEPVLPGRWGIH